MLKAPPETAPLRWDDSSAGTEDLPYSPRFDDHYYSRHDGRAETDHVFLAGNGLPQRWEGRSRFVIGELGFGTGLNLLQTWYRWREHRKPHQHLFFQSVEAFPMDNEAAWRAVSRWPDLADLAQILFDTPYLENGPVFLDEQTSFQCEIGFAHDRLGSFHDADAWFLDGFAPARNPDMWSEELMKTVAEKTVNGGTFASYTAAGWVRRNLQDAGFIVEKRTGFGSKRDMIAGFKP